MNVMTGPHSILLWQDVVRNAEKECAVSLENALEEYLISLLFKYINKPDAIGKVFATAFLQAMQQQPYQRHHALQQVGDECLLLTGLFPRVANKRCVKIRYFVDLGQAAYTAISNRAKNDLYNRLAVRFVLLMDVLQSIRQYNDLLPFEAYEQWYELGSQRAFKILQSYNGGIPFKIDQSYLK
jgi:hypothetical protein